MAEENDSALLTRDKLSAFALLGLTLLLLYLSYLLIKPFVPALSWALALAVVTYPIHNFVSRKIPKPDIASGISVTLIALLFVIPIAVVTHYTTQQAQEALEMLRSEESQKKWTEFREQYPRVGQAVDWVRQQLALDSGASTAASQAGSTITQILAGGLGAVVQVLIALFVLFFFYRDKRHLVGYSRGVLPLTHQEADYVFRVARDTLHAALYGHVAVAMVQGALGGLMFWLLGLPAPLLWGVVMGLLAIIPVLGAFVIWVPAAIFLAVSGSVWKAVALALWGTVVVGTIDNVLYPVLVGRRLRLHTLAVFLAIVGGLGVFGTAGIVLGPLVLALLMSLVTILKRRTADGEGAEQNLRAA